MSTVAKARLLGIFAVLSLVFAGLFIFPVGAQTEGMANLKVLVKNQKEENIETAHVQCVNVHSGAVYDLFWSAEDGWFESDVAPGTYQVFASSKGYVPPVEPQMVYKFTEASENVPQIIITLTKIGSEGMARVHVTDDGNDVEGAQVHIFGPGGAHLQEATTPKGFANISTPLGLMHMLVFSEGMLTHSEIINITGTIDVEVPLIPEPASDDGSYRVMGLVKNKTTFVPGINVYIWDGVNEHIVPHEETDDGALSLPLYASTFHILLASEGYEPYWAANIDLSVNPHFFRPANNVFEMQKIGTPASKETIVNMAGASGITEPLMMTTWTLDANSKVYGTRNSFGSPRMQSSGIFYSADWLDVSASEEDAVQESLTQNGPAWISTNEFVKVNGHSYDANMESYSVSLSGLEGDVFEAGVNPVAVMTTSYKTDLTYEKDDDLRVEVFSLFEDETIEFILPANYEILGDFGDKAEFPNDNTSRLLVKEPLEFNAKVKEGPEAKLTFKNYADFYRVNSKKYIVNVDENVTLSGRSSKDPVGEITQYFWELPAQATIIEGAASGTSEDGADEIIVQFTANSNSYFNVTLMVLDSSGLRSAKDWILLMPDDLAPVVTNYTVYDIDAKKFLGSPYAVDEDRQLELNASTATDNGEITSYVWSFNDGTGTLNGKVVKHRFADPGTFNISLKVVDAVGNEQKVANQTIDVKDITDPLPVIKPFSETKQGDKVEMNATQSYDPRTSGKDYDAIVNFTWYLYRENENYTKQFAIGHEKVFKYVFTEPGNWKVNLSVVDESGNSGWVEKVLFVGGPDLQVRSMTFSDPDQNHLKEGDKPDISILIANDGSVSTKANVSWNITIMMGSEVIKTDVITKAIGNGKTVYFNFTTKKLKEAKEKEFKVILDNGNVIKETSETNNEFKMQVTITEKNPFVQWWMIVIVIVIILAIYVIFMKFTRGQWGYEPIVDLWKKRMG